MRKFLMTPAAMLVTTLQRKIQRRKIKNLTQQMFVSRRSTLSRLNSFLTLWIRHQVQLCSVSVVEKKSRPGHWRIHFLCVHTYYWSSTIVPAYIPLHMATDVCVSCRMRQLPEQIFAYRTGQTHFVYFITGQPGRGSEANGSSAKGRWRAVTHRHTNTSLLFSVSVIRLVKG